MWPSGSTVVCAVSVAISIVAWLVCLLTSLSTMPETQIISKDFMTFLASVDDGMKDKDWILAAVPCLIVST